MNSDFLEQTAEVASQDAMMYRDEIANKVPYRPSPLEQAYVAALKSEFYVDANDDQRAYDFFQRRSKIDWMTQNQEDSYALYHLTKKDPWRSNVRSMTIPKKIDVVLGAIGDLNLQPETHSFTMFGEEAKAMGDAMDVLMQHARERDLADRKFMSACRYLLTYGTACRHVAWRETKVPDKIISKEYPDGRCEWSDTGSYTSDSRIWTEVDAFNRVIWGDVAQKYADLQPRKWRVRVVPYGVARMLFKDNPAWKYVKPTKLTGNQWIDLDTQNQTEWAQNAWWIVLLEYENLPRNCMALLANGILMTPVNRPMSGKYAHKKYSNTLNQLFELDPAFYAGDSLVRRLHNDAALLDFFTNALVDYTRQDLVPPVIVSFRNAVSRSMFRPGEITRASGDFKVQNLLQGRHGFDEAMALTQFIEANLEKMVKTEMQKAPPGQGQPTAYALREQMKSNLSALFTVFMAVADMERDTAELMSLQILDHYPDLGIGEIDSELGKLAGIKQVFSAKGVTGKNGQMGALNVAFADIPQDKPGYEKLNKQVRQDQVASAKFGSPKKWFLLNRDDIDNYRHMFFVQVNQEDRKSKKADRQQVRDDAAFLAQLMGQVPEALLRETISSMGKNPDDIIPKQPPQPPQQPQQQGQAPQQQPAPGQGQAPQITDQKMNQMDQAMA